MKKNLVFAKMLVVTLAACSFALTGCATPPVHSGEAIDSLGVSQLRNIQFYTGSAFQLNLMRTKSHQLDANATIKKGVPSYSRETITVKADTPVVVVRHQTAPDGRLILYVALDEDETKLLRFIQGSKELHYGTKFYLMYEAGYDTGKPGVLTIPNDVEYVKYGNAFYSVTPIVETSNSCCWLVPSEPIATNAVPTLRIRENAKIEFINVKGRKLQ